MANPVNNGGISVNVNLGKSLDVSLKLGATARPAQRGNSDAINNVNNNYNKNPNHSRPVEIAGDADAKVKTQSKGGDLAAPPKAQKQDGRDTPHENRTARSEFPNRGEDATTVNRPNRGEQGKTNNSETVRGQQKTANQNQTPPIIANPNERGDGEKRGQTRQNQTPPIFTPNEPHGQDHQPDFGEHYSIKYNLRANDNQPNSLIRTVVSQVLGQNDVYLSRNSLNRLLNNQNLPHEANQLVQTISSRVLSTLDNSQLQGKLIHEVSKEISQHLQENIQTAKSVILKSSDFDAIPFKNLNAGEKMHVVIELMPLHLPEKTLEHLMNCKPNDVLSGLLLTRGLIVPGENAAEVRHFVEVKVLPQSISMTNLRDVGQLVKVLIADTVAAKTTANLDLAVQKFVKILVANNELGVLLATINLASQAQNQSGSVGRSLALAQIYDLIGQLIQAGEKSLKDAAPDKNILSKDRNIFQTGGVSKSDESDKNKALTSKLHQTEAAGSLRQFLEFNPGFINDKAASSFHNREDARQAKKDFVNFYHQDIEQWLKSGNHRFVKDYSFEKPVGVVVERHNQDIFTANTARFVLVRDGSVQGWHFLKTFLVK